MCPQVGMVQQYLAGVSATKKSTFLYVSFHGVIGRFHCEGVRRVDFLYIYIYIDICGPFLGIVYGRDGGGAHLGGLLAVLEIAALVGFKK